MSIFPMGTSASGRRPAITGRDPRLEADFMLVRPISGQIYLIEEEDLETLWNGRTPSSRSGLVSRH